MSDQTLHYAIAIAAGIAGAIILSHILNPPQTTEMPEPMPAAAPTVDAAPVMPSDSTPPVQDIEAKEGQKNRVVKGVRGVITSDRRKPVNPNKVFSRRDPQHVENVNPGAAPAAKPPYVDN
jgi:hypothetical protein